MEGQRPAEPNKAGEQPRSSELSSEIESDTETIANRVVDAFWEGLKASKEDPS